MSGAPSVLANLLADCDAHDIRLALADGGELEIDAPVDALTPDLLGRLEAHKSELQERLRSAPEPLINQADASKVWHATLDRLEGDPSFPPDVMERLRAADVGWGDYLDPAPPVERSDVPAKSTKAICRCGGTVWRDVPIHNGQSVRRDCGRCGRFLDFPVWYGKKNPLGNEKQ